MPSFPVAAAHMLVQKLLNTPIPEQQQQLRAQASLADTLEGVNLCLSVKQVT